MKQIVQKAASEWLSLRRPVDEVARQEALPAIAALSAHLAEQLAAGQAAHIVDLGAGTGANMAFLAPRLTVPQLWTLIDRDEDLLDEVPKVLSFGRVTEVRRLALDLDELDDILMVDGPTLVTCTAVLDVLMESQVLALATRIAERGFAVLFSLSVTGRVRLHPAMELDARIETAFNAHQRRGGLAGARATALAASVLSAGGFDVTVIETPWALASGHEALIERYLTDRVAAAVEHDPSLGTAAQAWLEARLSQLHQGSLSIEVGHQDLMALPAP